jgi:hypothetical protein
MAAPMNPNAHPTDTSMPSPANFMQAHQAGAPGSTIQRPEFGVIDLPQAGGWATGFADRPRVEAPDTYHERSWPVKAILGALILGGPNASHRAFRLPADARLDWRRNPTVDAALRTQAPDNPDDLPDFLRGQVPNLIPGVVQSRLAGLGEAMARPQNTTRERIARRLAIGAQAGRVALATAATFPVITRRAGRLAETVLWRNPPEYIHDALFGYAGDPAMGYAADPYRPQWATGHFENAGNALNGPGRLPARVGRAALHGALGVVTAVAAAPATAVRFGHRRRAT